MKVAWMVAVAMMAAMSARAGSRDAASDALVTVFAYDNTGVPLDVLSKAQRIAASALATAGVSVRWVKGDRIGEPRKVAAGEVLVVAFDGAAPAGGNPLAMAATSLGGVSPPEVHVFYRGVVNRGTTVWDRAHIPEVLGNVLAHELTHALQGVARHSHGGLMKAVWLSYDFIRMADGPLAFSPDDVTLLRAHFRKQLSQTGAVGSR